MTSMRRSAAFLSLLVIAFQTFGADIDDARFKEIYTKEWAWRQAQRGEIDEDSEALSQKAARDPILKANSSKPPGCRAAKALAALLAAPTNAAPRG